MTCFSMIIFLVLVVLHQSQSSYQWERFVDYEPKDSLACYRTLTLDLFQNLKKVVPNYCVQDGENEFKSKIMSRNKYYALIKKDGNTKELFIKGQKQAEDIASKTIAKIQRCLSYSCNKEKHEELNKFTKSFRNRSIGCGDSEYLSDDITTLEQTCIAEKKEQISKKTTSMFSGNESRFREMNSFWV